MKNTLSAMQADYIFFKQTLMNLQHSWTIKMPK
jgi:hypothetical protein